MTSVETETPTNADLAAKVARRLDKLLDSLTSESLQWEEAESATKSVLTLAQAYATLTVPMVTRG